MKLWAEENSNIRYWLKNNKNSNTPRMNYFCTFQMLWGKQFVVNWKQDAPIREYVNMHDSRENEESDKVGVTRLTR